MPGLSCNACNKEFNDDAEQKLHYKSEWHRYNLKRKVCSFCCFFAWVFVVFFAWFRGWLEIIASLFFFFFEETMFLKLENLRFSVMTIAVLCFFS